jgi:predicted hydrolase (HD superfamily)
VNNKVEGIFSMSDEPVLDNNTRNSILASIGNLKKPVAKVQEAKIPEFAEKFVESTKKTTSTKTVCKSCSHKIWNDGEEWLHSGMLHNDNCECREAVPSDEAKTTFTPVSETKVVQKKKVFDSTTPFNELLEACAESHTAIVEEQTVASDEVRMKVLKETNADCSLLKGWKF